jgi:hypothetical protein
VAGPLAGRTLTADGADLVLAERSRRGRAEIFRAHARELLGWP